jgi:hypothetical protein
MDAANPLSRCTLAVGLVLAAAAGCLSAPPAGRGQAPPYEPLPPVAPLTTNDPVPGQAVPAGYSPAGPGVVKPVIPRGAPQVKVVAVVGAGNIVTDQEVWEAVRQRMGEYIYPIDGPNGKEVRRDDAKEKAIYYEELRRIIERELVLDEMWTRLKKAKPGAIDEIKEAAGKMADRQLLEFKKMYKVKSDDEFQAILATQQLTLPGVRRQLERQMMAEEYVRTMIKDKIRGIGLAQIRGYYDRHPEEFRTEDRVKWLDIFVSVNRFPTVRAAYDHALAVQQKAAGGADFLALVKEHDHGVAARQNGEGIGQKRGEIRPADVEETVWSLKAGQVSGLIETPTGYHIVKIAERDHAGVKPFTAAVQDEVRKKLSRQLVEQERAKLVEDLWWRGVVKVLIEVP